MSEIRTGDAPRTTSGRRRYLLIPLVIFAALAALLYGRLYSGDPAALPSALIGRPAPDMTLPALEGLTRDGAAVPGFSRADLAAGEVTLVNVFASWCGPCRDEHPMLMRLKDQGLPIVGLNYKDSPENARRFLGGLGNPYGKVGVDAAGRASIEWGVYGVPETFVVDGQGRIAFKFVGPLSEEAVRVKLMPAIEKAKAGAGK
ncbi:DsbE family thiol:disulfide interchange protein [Chenggangzhangella methanolivorans]|uniref:DsbE family thiol:disulfide interchange protein n=1 Tax=Chenggangzhangella methanolivorans TaxID=1437009 RepID=A0A9E6RBS0_9HYPH|nr:DsbE family thiol:disulfide interchange protein [Chenggangzhangella methanolivorans]QZO01889.1 DsbE family thiol:disulfide interchange protein [Chenggangzhangella methanolivorans]